MNDGSTNHEAIVLARNTYEATLVLRRGDWVYKYLKPEDAFATLSVFDRMRELRLRAQESHRHAELNPQWYDARRNCLISRFAAGRPIATREASVFLRMLIATGRGYLVDLHEDNLVWTATGPIAIDFSIATNHPDWQRRFSSVPPFFVEEQPCRFCMNQRRAIIRT
jgi:hypothetical protein